ncbi:MAG: bifunctional nicotinamidase/pyrazinamidase [Coriobacteriia bacterium]|nr:bifunctional nicotinamidase/pyrazinamidase [Coriobacteriia bacterium]
MHALLLIDIQNDFMPFGSLPVPLGDEVVGVANVLAPLHELVVATQDWHPAEHGSFASNHRNAEPGETVVLGGVDQVLWPDHCVQDAPGASFHSGLDIAHVDIVVRKGTDSAIDSYSGFRDNGHQRDTGLASILQERGVGSVALVGLATDYCVKYTALDGIALGLRVSVVEDGVRAVDLASGDGAASLAELRAAGCEIVSLAGALARADHRR